MENFKHLSNSTLLFWRVSGGWKEGPGPVSPEGGSCRPRWKGAGSAGFPGHGVAGTSLRLGPCRAASRFSVLRGRRGRLRACVRVRVRGRGRAVRLAKPRCQRAQELIQGLPFPPSQVTRERDSASAPRQRSLACRIPAVLASPPLQLGPPLSFRTCFLGISCFFHLFAKLPLQGFFVFVFVLFFF